MGSLFTSLSSAAGAMLALQRSLNVVQNNIANTSTPGYARQEGSLIANPYNPNGASTSGGVSAGLVRSTRDAYLESSVWKTQHRTGYSAGLTAQLTNLERAFPLADGAGIAGEMTRFFGSVSQWSLSPNDVVARRQVLDRAGGLAQSFQGTAQELGASAARSGAEISATVRKINSLTADIAAINTTRRESLSRDTDAGLDGTLHSKLEELSQYVDFTALPQEDGTVSVFLGGQSPAVIGGHQWSVSAANAGPTMQLLDADGGDISGRIGGGKLGALLEFHNQLLPGYRTELDSLAQGFADRVNQVLNAGVDLNGAAPAANLFTYNPAVGAAASLAVTGITVSDLAAAVPGDPGGNTNALNLADLQNSGILSGLSPTQFFAGLTASVGDRLNSEKTNGSLQRQLLQQAQTLRAEFSGVDINAEATKLLQLQKGFQASGQVLSVLNSLTETVINLIR